MKNAMAALLNKSEGKFESTAKVVDGNLIISLPDAINPIVWRMELGSVKASALEVKKNDGDGTYVLSLKTPKGEVHDIAPYAAREGAVTALMRVSGALQSAEGRMVATPQTNLRAEQTGNAVFVKPDAGALKWIAALVGVIVLVFLFAALSKTSSGIRVAEEIPGQTSASSTTGEAQSESGVAQSADDMLKGY